MSRRQSRRQSRLQRLRNRRRGHLPNLLRNLLRNRRQAMVPTPTPTTAPTTSSSPHSTTRLHSKPDRRWSGFSVSPPLVPLDTSGEGSSAEDQASGVATGRDTDNGSLPPSAANPAPVPDDEQKSQNSLLFVPLFSLYLLFVSTPRCFSPTKSFLPKHHTIKLRDAGSTIHRPSVLATSRSQLTTPIPASPSSRATTRPPSGKPSFRPMLVAFADSLAYANA
jgi:hypothetical protein